MITEKEVAGILPPNSWITEYITYCASQTTSPLAYHLGVGLTVMAMSCPTNYTMRFFGMMPTNMFVLLAGRSGEDQKSTALGLGEEILDKANYELIGDQPGSAEGLVDALSEQNKQCLLYSEFGQFLSQAKGGYMESVKTTMTNLWDGKNVSRRKAGDNIIRAENPRLSIIGACSLPYLEQYTTGHDWSGGFMGRWLLMYARRERTMAFPPNETPQIKKTRDWLAGTLQQNMEHQYSDGTICLGLDTDAKDLWKEWYHSIQARELPTMISGTATRCPAIAMRVCMIFAWDIGTSRKGENWYIDVDCLNFGINVAELHLKSVISLSERLAEHPDALFRRKIMGCFPFHGDIVSLGDILKITKMRKRTVVELIEGLLLEGYINEIPVDNTKNRVFERVQ
jgi:hypothetical protein